MKPILPLFPNMLGYFILPNIKNFSSAYRSSLFLLYLNSNALFFHRYLTSLDSSRNICSASLGGMFSLNFFSLIE